VPPFLPGLQLCRAFYEDAVRPLVDEAYPGLPYAAARVGPGSEVVGYDTARSTDHDWGPRLELFLAAEDVDRYARPLADLLAARLPTRVRGWPTHFTPGGKWLGTAFAALPGATSIGTALRTALADPDQREDALCTAYESAGRWQNALGLAEPVDPVRRPFHDRPYLVVDAARFATALRTRITDPELAARPLVGAVDQYVDSTDVLARPELTRAIHQATRT
jgi:hypothetical protein